MLLVSQEQITELQKKFEPLKPWLAQPIANEDNVAKLEKWNAYWTVMDQIDAVIKDNHIDGVVLARNMKSNLTNDNFFVGVILMIGAMILSFALAIALSNPVLIMLGILGLPMLAVPELVMRIRRWQSKTITISCAPVLHINELEFAHHIVKGLPKIKKDPEIHLPPFKFEIPRAELARMSADKAMDLMKHIKLPDLN